MTRVLLIAPNCDATDVGEAWSTHQWARRLAERCDLTVLTYRKRDRPAASEQLPGVRVVEWLDLPGVGKFERFNSMLKPGYVAFQRRAQNWIKRALAGGERFDLAHQVSPLALRYASPAADLGIPFVMGPVGGSLDSPEPFRAEMGAQPWYVKLRALDRWRLGRGALRRTYADAEVVVGVAPYVRELLVDAGIEPKRFEIMSETGVTELPPPRPVRARREGELRLLFVGRVIRMKGVRDAVRALARLPDLPNVRMDVLGDGDDRAACETEAADLGLGDRVTFHGRVPRERCDEFYRNSDVFFFPSMREPSGNVVFEALGHGLPVIAADRGGPGYVVDETCGVKVAVTDPERYAEDLAGAVRRLATEPGLVEELARGARARIEALALWDNKIEWMTELYASVAGARRAETRDDPGRSPTAAADLTA